MSYTSQHTPRSICECGRVRVWGPIEAAAGYMLIALEEARSVFFEIDRLDCLPDSVDDAIARAEGKV